MKKLITVLLSLALCACRFGAAAENAPVTDDFPVAGLSVTYPQAFAEAKGLIGSDGVMQLDESVYLTYWYYFGVTAEEYQRAVAENTGELEGKGAILYYVFSVGGGRDFADITGTVSESTGLELAVENASEIGQSGSWKFYLYMNPEPEFAKGLRKEFGDEYTALLGLENEIASAYTCYEPFNESGEMDGKEIRFTAEDLEGNPVSSEEIFAQHDITMVNIWATWCGPCVAELGDLQKIHTRFLEKDCAVLGLLIDRDPEATARLIAENGIEYQVVYAPENFQNIFPFDAVPTSFYVDRNGRFLGTKFRGVATDMYESALEPLLEKVRQP